MFLRLEGEGESFLSGNLHRMYTIRYDTKAKLRPKVKMCEKIGLVIEKANALRTSEKMAVNLRVCFEGINLLKITIGA